MREEYIKNAQQRTGWVYPQLKWLTKGEERLANKARAALLRSLSGRVSYSFKKNKLHIGPLSPGCMICGQGYWSCLYMNVRCTAKCFYCPQDRAVTKEVLPYDEYLIHGDPKDYAAYLEKFRFRGAGFSGGEPFLVLDKLVAYIEAVRKRFGSAMYLWAYTNGDLVTEDKLRRLNKAGLDEIRFDISARRYDLDKAALAARIMKTVSIEIPAIPEDSRRLQQCLPRMKKIGIRHLNLHQLIASPYNYKNFMERGYTFLHQPNICMLESEISALELIRYALDHGVHLPINYCSGMYKDSFQSKGLRERISSLIKKDWEEITEPGYIRSFSIRDSSASIRKVIASLKGRNRAGNLWATNDARTERFFHGSLLENPAIAGHNITVRYFGNLLAEKPPVSAEEAGKISLRPGRDVYFGRLGVGEYKDLSAVAMMVFKKMFIEKMGKKEILEHLAAEYGINTKDDLLSFKNLMARFIPFESKEHVAMGFPDFY